MGELGHKNKKKRNSENEKWSLQEQKSEERKVRLIEYICHKAEESNWGRRRPAGKDEGGVKEQQK